MPSHIGVSGNDTVDRLAKAAFALDVNDVNAVSFLCCFGNNIYSGDRAMTVHRRDADRASSVSIQHHDHFLHTHHQHRRHGLMFVDTTL